jgi:hypothetical protein
MIVHQHIDLAGLLVHIPHKEWGICVAVDVATIARSLVFASKSVRDVGVLPSAHMTVGHERGTTFKRELSRTQFIHTKSFTGETSAGINARGVYFIMGMISTKAVPNLMHYLIKAVGSD